MLSNNLSWARYTYVTYPQNYHKSEGVLKTVKEKVLKEMLDTVYKP